MSASTAAPPAVVGARRPRRGSAELRDRLLTAALAEFSEHGFDGASTRAIAERAGAHQPQINYHFDSKEALWRAAVERLMDELDEVFDDVFADLDDDDVRGALAGIIRGLVRFAAARPELNRIMIQEGTADGDRLRWIVDHHVRDRHRLLVDLWSRAVDHGLAAPVNALLIHHLLVGAASLFYANAPEARLLLDVEPTDPALVSEHADTLVALLLPKED